MANVHAETGASPGRKFPIRSSSICFSIPSCCRVELPTSQLAVGVMRRAFLLFAFALLACSGVVEATKSDQNAIASSVSLSNGDAKRRSLQADAIDGQASRRLRPVPELTTGGDPGPSTSLMSTIRAKIANWKYKRWFKKGRKPEQVDEDLDLTDEDDKELSEGYHRYYDMRTGQSVSYFGTDGSRSRNSE